MHYLHSLLNILLVEDDKSVAYTLTMALGRAGFSVRLAEDGDIGWKEFRSNQPDLVISDIRMPGMDGIELLRRIKAISPDMDVILLTGHGDLSSAKQAVELGALRYLEKPINQMSDLVGSVRTATMRKRLARDRELIDRISFDES